MEKSALQKKKKKKKRQDKGFERTKGGMKSSRAFHVQFIFVPFSTYTRVGQVTTTPTNNCKILY